MKLLLIRHTAVTGTDGICYGRTDVPLAASFAAEAAAVRAALRAILAPPPWTLYASPALRCRLLAETFDVPATVDPRLGEVDFGDWDGRAWNELPRSALDGWCENFVHARPPGGESFTDLITRAEAFVADIARRHPHGTVLAVTHAGIIRALLAPRRGLGYIDAFSIAVPHGSIHLCDAAPEGLA
ncbi:MAG: histidine phosphatase family protein [Rhodopila sp.]